jgi:hypothetical protein
MDLREQIEQMEDAFLVEQYQHKKEDYTEQAVAIMKEVLAQRNLTEEQMAAMPSESDDSESVGIQVTHDEFASLPELFGPMDLPALHALLRDKAIPFTIETACGQNMSEEGEQRREFHISVPSGKRETAISALEEHFEVVDGHYRMRYSSIKERLQAFNFQEVQVSNLDVSDEVEVMFAPEEKKTIAAYARRLLDDAERIEHDTDRVIFYYDSIETLIEHCENRRESAMHGADLLTIMEILQIYCMENDFPQSMESVAAEIFKVMSK